MTCGVKKNNLSRILSSLSIENSSKELVLEHLTHICLRNELVQQLKKKKEKEKDKKQKKKTFQ